MAEEILLSNSNYCRLCGEENDNGIDMYSEVKNGESLSILINRYLPIKVDSSDLLPKVVCPGCHFQLETTKLFMDLIVDGQAKLKILLKTQEDLLKAEENKASSLKDALHNEISPASIETYTIQTDEDGEKYYIQIYSEAPLFSPEHELSLKAEGLDKPKRKRGRPPKLNTTSENTINLPDTKGDKPETCKETEEKSVKEDSIEINGRKRRKIKAPARYEGLVQGKELDSILLKEGVLDDDYIEIKEELIKEDIDNDVNSSTPIGKVVTTDGKDLGRAVFGHPNSKKRKKRIREKYTCEICQREFLHFGRYNLHKKGHNVKYVCQESGCQLQDYKKDVILEHQKESGHTGISLFEQINEYNCTIVPRNPDEVPLIKGDYPDSSREDRTETEDKSLKCLKCNKVFSCKQNYLVHIKAVHEGKKPFQCEFCPRSFGYAYSLKWHILSHKKKEDATEQFLCDKCDKVFNHPSSLVYHKDTEHGNQRFVCNKCDKSFKHRQLLQRHQLVHSEARPFKCKECSQSFKCKSHLVNHEIIHSGVKKYVCPTCGQGFAHKTSLSFHLKWHEGTKPYACDVCQKQFSQKGNLAEHKRIHTGEKPYACEVCGKSFTTSSQYKLHKKRHTGEKPFTCNYCQKKFLYKDSLATHIRRHLDMKPFKCRFCTKAFIERGACSTHERIHLGEKPYKCQVCEKTFNDISNFNKHKKVHLKNGIKPLELKMEKNSDPDGGENAENQPTIDIQIITIPESDTAMEKESDSEITHPGLQIQELVDHEGNSISFTTADGQPIPIVSSGKEKLQGLMPDGTLISLNLVSDEQNKVQESASSDINLINSEIQFLEDKSSSSGTENLNQDKQTFLTADGRVCFITSFMENSFLNIS